VIITPALTLTVNVWVTETAPRESVAVAVNENDVGCATVGAVPLRVVPFWVSQEGRLPNVQLTAPVPPTAVNVCEYAVPGPAEGRGLEVVMVRGALTMTDNIWVRLAAPVLSVTVAEKLNGVAEETAGAVPLRIAPVRLSHAGRLADANVSAPVPPAATRVWV
jgi:hypothetical protein